MIKRKAVLQNIGMIPYYQKGVYPINKKYKIAM